MLFSLAEYSARLFELAGLAAMVGGLALTLVIGLIKLKTAGPSKTFRWFRQRLGRTIMLGLEFLVAADILRTIAERPTLRGVAVLGGIVLIRTFLSFTLEVEIEGRWPWQRSAAPEPQAPPREAPAS